MVSRNPPPGKVKMTLTLNVDPDLKKRLKARAAQRETYVQDLVIEAIEKELARE